MKARKENHESYYFRKILSGVMVFLVITQTIFYPFPTRADEISESNTTTSETAPIETVTLYEDSTSESTITTPVENTETITIYEESNTIDTPISTPAIENTENIETGSLDENTLLNTSIITPIENGISTGLPLISPLDYPLAYQITNPILIPELETILPLLIPISNESDYFYHNTIESYNVINRTTSMTYCSKIAHLNLEKLVGGDSVFAKGDAISLWDESNSEIIENNLNNFLLEQGIVDHKTIYDIVSFSPSESEELSSSGDITQFHRFIIFLATDNKRYVLDPIRGETTQAIELENYESKHRKTGELYKIIATYTPSPLWKSGLDYVINSTEELLKYKDLSIIELQSNNENDIKDTIKINKNIAYQTEDMFATASLHEGTTITTANGENIDINTFSFHILKSEEKSITKKIQITGDYSLLGTVILNGKKIPIPLTISENAKKVSGQGSGGEVSSTDILPGETIKEKEITIEHRQFQFGIPNQHLKFSQPVQLEYPVKLPDGSSVDIAVKHGTDEEFGFQGLSTDAATTCENGESSIPGSQATVIDGTVKFWTCGASTFSLTYTGAIDDAHFIDFDAKGFSVEFLTGVHFPTGALIRDVNISINWRPIDNESTTGAWGTGDCFPREKYFYLANPEESIYTVLLYPGTLATPSDNCPEVTNIFDDDTPNAEIYDDYSSGTYKPYPGEYLSNFNGTSPFGTRTLYAGDDTLGHGMVLYGFTLEISTGPKITNADYIPYPENSNTDIVDIESVDPIYAEGAGLSYSITGVDSSFFSIDSSSGIITWFSEPEYSNPLDSDNNNQYELAVIVTNDNSETYEYNITISVIKPIGSSCISTIDISSTHACLTSSGSSSYCRGTNTSRQLADGTNTQRLVPTAATEFGSSIIQSDAGTNASFIVTTSGQVKAIGANTNGQLGDGTLINKTSPVDILTGAIRTYSTQFTSCALIEDTSVKCRGRNSFGQVGDGTTGDQLSPVNVKTTGLVNNLTGVSNLALQPVSTCILKLDGTVRCRGRNNNGQLGDGTTGDRLVPTAVTGSLTGITQIAVGVSHSCALKQDGTVRCRGFNNAGQLGDGTTGNKLIPTAVTGGLTGIVSIAANFISTCALNNSGKIRCRGSNINGQLGDGTYDNKLEPNPIFDMDNWSAHQIFSNSSIGSTFCASTLTGSIVCRGANNVGQLGVGIVFPNYTIPIAMNTDITLDVNDSCPINFLPIIQNNSGNDISLSYDGGAITPLIDIETFDYTYAEGSGLSYSLSGVDSALFTVNSSGIVSWVSSPSYSNPLDGGADNVYDITVIVSNIGGKTDTINLAITIENAIGSSCKSQIELDELHTCMTTTGGTVKCRGLNSNRQLADGTPTQRTSPVNSTQWGSSILHTDAATEASFTVTTTGLIRAIGKNTNGQLGDGTITDRTSPVDILTGALRIHSTSSTSCALMADSGVKCRGRNGNGQVGDGTFTQQNSPVDVKLTGLTANLMGVADVVLQQLSTCALKKDGTVRCRGTNGNGQLGNGTTGVSNVPVQVTGGISNTTQIVAGAAHSCALKNDGTVRCRGFNDRGQVGNGSSGNSIVVPTMVTGGLTGIVGLAAAGGSSCALKDNGKIRCWGNNSNGQLGDGTLIQKNFPTLVTGMVNRTGHQIFGSESRGSHFCAISTTGSTFCRGRNSNGQLGDGSTTQRTSPRAVSGGLTLDVGYTCPIYFPPIIQNNSGNDILIAYPDESLIAVIDIESFDYDGDSEGSGLSYSLSGVDSALFSINSSGILSWISSPDYNTPLDTGGDNNYDIVIIVTDSAGLSDQIIITIQIGDLCIESPDTFSIGSITIDNTSQVIEAQSEYFKVSDRKGSNSGYYTTLSLGNLTGSLSGIISNSLIEVKADPLVTLSGTSNPYVVLSTGITTYTPITSPINFIQRESGTGGDILGTYGSKVTLKTTIPAYQTIDSYNGVLTYTLYEN